ncbi:MAG: RNA 2',3'-cyclic phosphodiesterase [Candidatus Omnitrophota bacterium]
MEEIRSFIALELTPEIQEELARVQTRLKTTGADVKWVNPEGIHLTLKFLGEISPALLEEVKQILNALAPRHQCFELKITRLGAFPNEEHPRVIWVGTEPEKNRLTQIVQELAEGLINLGFFKEKRPFAPHLTLGRVRSPHNREQLKQALQTTSVEQKVMRVTAITLFKSTLTPQGAIYQSLHKAPFLAV